MDGLPSDLLLQTLTYLSGNDVGRFKQLNKTIRDVISKYRDKLKLPEVNFGLSDFIEDENSPGQKIQMEFTYDKYSGKFVIDCENPKAIVVDSSIGKIWRDFLAPFFNNEKEIKEKYIFRKAYDFVLKKIDVANLNESRRPATNEKSVDRSLRSVLDFIFERIDIAELYVTNLSNVECISVLTEAIKHSPVRILCVKTFPKTYSCSELCNLLNIIAIQKRKTKEYPLLLILEKNSQNAALKSHLRQINEVASLFKSAAVKTRVSRTWTVIRLIAEEWRIRPFEKFFFGIRITSYNNYTPRRQLYIIAPDFRITHTISEYFEFCDGSNVNSSISMEDRDRGNLLEFEKTRVEPPSKKKFLNGRPTGVVHISISAVIR